MAKFNSDDQRSEEFWVTESVYNKEDLKFVFERYIKGMSKDLVEEFKHVTGYKDEIDQFVDNHGVKLVRADEAFTKAEFDEMMRLAAEVGIKTVAELQDFSKQVGGAKDQDLLAALKKAVDLKNNPEKNIRRKC